MLLQQRPWLCLSHQQPTSALAAEHTRRECGGWASKVLEAWHAPRRSTQSGLAIRGRPGSRQGLRGTPSVRKWRGVLSTGVNAPLASLPPHILLHPHAIFELLGKEAQETDQLLWCERMAVRLMPYAAQPDTTGGVRDSAKTGYTEESRAATFRA